MADLLKSVELLRELIGRRILHVRRQLFLDDLAKLDKSIAEQEADGPAEFHFDNGQVAHIVTNTTLMSIELKTGLAPKYGDSYSEERDVSSNYFWSSRIGIEIESFVILQSLYDPEGSLSAYGLEFVLAGGNKFLVEYVNDEIHFDQLRIAASSDDQNCRRTQIR